MRFRSGRLGSVAPWLALALVGTACQQAESSLSQPTTDVVAVTARLPLPGVNAGRPDAPVTLVEFGSYACPTCRRFAVEVYPTLETRYIKTGRLRYRYVDVSPEGPPREIATLVTCATNARDDIGDMRHWLFSDSALLQVRGRAALVGQMAHHVGMDSTALDRRALEEATGELHARERAAAESLGVTGTPTFVVGSLDARGQMTGLPQIGYASGEALFARIDTVTQMLRTARP